VRSELLNLSLFVSAIAKVLLMTGVGLGGAVALFAECCGFRVVALGLETFGVAGARRGLRVRSFLALLQQRRRSDCRSIVYGESTGTLTSPLCDLATPNSQVRAGQLAPKLNLIPANEFNGATSPARKVKTWRTA
jgi:hypothetical protein